MDGERRRHCLMKALAQKFLLFWRSARRIGGSGELSRMDEGQLADIGLVRADHPFEHVKPCPASDG